LPFLLLSGALGNGNNYFGNSYAYDSPYGNNPYGNNPYGNNPYGNSPLKNAVLLSGVASGSVSPFAAVAASDNPGFTAADGLVVSSLGNNALSNLLVLGQAPGQGLLDNGGPFAPGYSSGPFGPSYYSSPYSSPFGTTYYNAPYATVPAYTPAYTASLPITTSYTPPIYNGPYYNSGPYYGNGPYNNGISGALPTLALAGALGGGSSGLGTLLALGALSNNNGYGGYYGNYNGGLLGNVNANLNNLFG